jgi:hypothetical protein
MNRGQRAITIDEVPLDWCLTCREYRDAMVPDLTNHREAYNLLGSPAKHNSTSDDGGAEIAGGFALIARSVRLYASGAEKLPIANCHPTPTATVERP